MTLFLMFVVPALVVALVACSRSSAQLPVSDEPIFAKVIVTTVVLSEDESQVKSITVRIEEEDEVAMRLSDDIDPTLWGVKGGVKVYQWGGAIVYHPS